MTDNSSFLRLAAKSATIAADESDDDDSDDGRDERLIRQQKKSQASYDYKTVKTEVIN